MAKLKIKEGSLKIEWRGKTIVDEPGYNPDQEVIELQLEYVGKHEKHTVKKGKLSTP